MWRWSYCDPSIPVFTLSSHHCPPVCVFFWYKLIQTLPHFHLLWWLILFMAGSNVMVKWKLVFDNRLHVCGRSEISQNSDRVCSKNEICETWHSHLQSTVLLHMYTLAPTVMPLLEAPLELLLWHNCDTCSHNQLKFFCGWRMMSLDHVENCSSNWKYYHCLPSIFSPYLCFLIKIKTNSQSTPRFITMPLDSSLTFISLQQIGPNIKKELGTWVWKSLIGYL